MTAKEKALIRLAIKTIHTDDDYYTGMDILWRLIGETPPDIGELKEIDIRDIHNGPVGPFKDPLQSLLQDNDSLRPVGFHYKNKQQ